MRAVVVKYLRPRMHIDFHLGNHFESGVRMLKLDARQRIAEGIDLIAPPKQCRLNPDGVFQTLLKGCRARHKVQQVMRVQHLACVVVGRSVMNAIAHGGLTSTPTAHSRCARNAALRAGPTGPRQRLAVP